MEIKDETFFVILVKNIKQKLNDSVFNSCINVNFWGTRFLGFQLLNPGIFRPSNLQNTSRKIHYVDVVYIITMSIYDIIYQYY